MSCAQRKTRAVHPKPLCTKANSFQDSVAVTEGREEMPSNTTRANPKTPVMRKHSPLHFIFSVPNTLMVVLFSDSVFGPHPAPSITCAEASTGSPYTSPWYVGDM